MTKTNKPKRKQIIVLLTESQNAARVILQNKLPNFNLSEFMRDALAQKCRDENIEWRDDMPAWGSESDLARQAQDLEDLMDIQEAQKEQGS